MSFDGDHIPDNTYTFKIVNPGDNRVTTNPAMQLLDYIMDKRYGKGLDLDRDIDLEGFSQAGRDCDTRSEITVQFASSASFSVGDNYKFPATRTNI